MGEYKYIYILDRKDTIGLGSGPGKSCKQTDLLNDLNMAMERSCIDMFTNNCHKNVKSEILCVCVMCRLPS